MARGRRQIIDRPGRSAGFDHARRPALASATLTVGTEAAVLGGDQFGIGADEVLDVGGQTRRCRRRRAAGVPRMEASECAWGTSWRFSQAHSRMQALRRMRGANWSAAPRGDIGAHDPCRHSTSLSGRRSGRRARASTAGSLGCPEGRAPSIGSTSIFMATRSSPIWRPSALAPAHDQSVDGDEVPVPHFGAVLAMGEWETSGRARWSGPASIS